LFCKHAKLHALAQICLNNIARQNMTKRNQLTLRTKLTYKYKYIN